MLKATLTKLEITKAIMEFVERKYNGQFSAQSGRLHYDDGTLMGATIELKEKKVE